MSRGWFGDLYRHSLASRGISTTGAIEMTIKKFGMKPHEINNGFCDEFTNAVIDIIPESSWRTSEDYEPELPVGHVWIYHNGKHYDAETPEGVDSPLDLVMFKRYFDKHPNRKTWYDGMVFN